MAIGSSALAALAVAALSGGAWRALPPAPVAPNGAVTAAWTGKQVVLFGRFERRAQDGAVLARTNVAAAYDPAANRWRTLPSPGQTSSFGGYSSVWTGRELLVWGPGTRLAFDPRTSRWRQLPSSRLLAVHDGFGLVAWTGRELVGWGGGCCGDAFSDGVAYDPARDAWRALARSPLAGSQHPIGAWDGHELLVFVGDFDPDGKPWPASLARAAAYDPATNRWRRIAPLPVAGGAAAWDGRELLVAGGGTDGRAALAYDPATDRWRRLAPLPSRAVGPTAIWTGKQLVVFGARTAFGYDPRTDRWSALPRAPVALGPVSATAWTGRVLFVWSGGEGALFASRSG